MGGHFDTTPASLGRFERDRPPVACALLSGLTLSNHQRSVEFINQNLLSNLAHQLITVRPLASQI